MAELNDKLITYGNLSTFHDNLINDSVTSGNSTWSSEKIASEIQQGGGGGGSATIENVTYAQLKAKRDNSQLVKGQQYRITDYVTMANSDTTTVSSAEHPFDLIVTAIDVNKLSETGVKVAHCANDDYFVVIPILYHIDENEGLGYSYDGAIVIDGVKYYKWYTDEITPSVFTILTEEKVYTNTPDGEDSCGEYYLTTYPFAGEMNSDEELREEDYWGSEEMKSVVKTEWYGTPMSAAIQVYDSENDVHKVYGRYSQGDTSEQYAWALAVESVGGGSQKDRETIDDITWWDLLHDDSQYYLYTTSETPSIGDTATGDAGTFEITDYQTDIPNGGILVIGDAFDCNTDGYQTQYEPKLNAWEAKYCLDNDKSRFDWAQVEEEGTGLGFAGLQVRGEKEVIFNKLVIGDEINPNGNNYEGEGHYYIDEGNYDYIEDGTIEDNGTIYYKWYCKNKNISVLTTQSNYTNSVSGEDGDGYEYYDTVFNVVGEVTIDGEEFDNLYKGYKRIIKTELETENLTGKFLYKRYEEGDSGNTYAWAYVRNSNNKSINDTNIDWDDIDTTDLLYTSSEEPAKGTETGDYEVVKYVDDVQHIYDGKGVIYYLKDEFNNKAEYDFKNVLFKQDFWAIQVYSEGEYYIYKRYPEVDNEDNGLYAFVYVNNSSNMSIEDVENNPWMWDDIDTTDIIYFYNGIPSSGDYDSNGEYQVIDSKMIDLGNKFTFGEASQNPIDDTFEGNSNNNTIESTITDGVKSIPVLDLGNETVDYGKITTAGENIQINNGVISATDTKYYAGSNISINSNNQISCTYQFPAASNNTLGGIVVGDGLSIVNNNTLTLSDSFLFDIYKLSNPEVSEYLTLEATADNCEVRFPRNTATLMGCYIECSTDGTNWTQYNSQNGDNITGVLLATLNTGDKLYLRSKAESGSSTMYTLTRAHITCSQDCYIYGNLISLYDKTNFRERYTCDNYGYFSKVFMNNTHIINHPNKKLVMPFIKLYIAPNTVANSMFDSMFEGCTGLTSAPDIIARTLHSNHFKRMFYGCTNLNYIKCLSVSGSSSDWLTNVASNGLCIKSVSLNRSNLGLPSSWTVQDA